MSKTATDTPVRPEAPQPVQGQRVTVIGGARSGLAVARLLAARGARVFLTDAAEAEAGLTDKLDEAGVTYEFGGHSRRALEADWFAISPGVPSTAAIVQQGVGMGLPVYSEVEVASWFFPGPIVAITGSNGKTTTTSLTAHIFRTAGRKHIVGGNIGYPFADYAEGADAETAAVLEVSSFQLDHIATFRPRVAVLLNITPDHLDRYGNDFNRYAQAKFRVFENLQPGDALVYNYDDELVHKYVGWWAPKHGITPYAISLEHEVARGGFLRDGHLVLRLPTTPDAPADGPSVIEETLMSQSHLALRGQHNVYNSLAAAIAARAMEIRSDVVRESLSSFEGVPHRLERVRELNGVLYVNDSKATNVNAVWYALESFQQPIVLIAGGRDKGNDYAPLKPLIRDKARAVIGVGESADKVVLELGDLADVKVQAKSMEEAVMYAKMVAEAGDVVLLSPACASFDQFRNYEDRGDTFKRLVMNL